MKRTYSESVGEFMLDAAEGEGHVIAGVVAHRNALIEAGISETAAEMMATQFHAFLHQMIIIGTPR